MRWLSTVALVVYGSGVYPMCTGEDRLSSRTGFGPLALFEETAALLPGSELRNPSTDSDASPVMRDHKVIEARRCAGREVEAVFGVGRGDDVVASGGLRERAGSPRVS